MRLSLRAALLCTCCEQYRDDVKASADVTTAALVGCVRYAICPICWQEVPNPWDAAYKRRWTRVVNQRRLA